MSVESLDHINVVTADLDRAVRFYTVLLGLEARPAPPPLTPANACWLYDGGGRAVLHLNTPAAPRLYGRDLTAGPTGALHHVAFRCTGRDAVLARVVASGRDHRCNAVPAIGLRQIFVTDPDGVLLELNFFGD